MRTTAALLVLFLTVPAAACGTETGPRPAPRTSAADGGDVHGVGADPDDAPCARVVSALGFADLLLLPPGQEDRQSFDDAVRGRLAYVGGVVRQYGPRLPEEALTAQTTLRRTAERLAPAATPLKERKRLLREYREAEGRVRAVCPVSAN